MSYSMPFGRHKGRDLTELEDSYLEWLLSLGNLREPLRSAVRQELKERGAEGANQSQNTDHTTNQDRCPDPATCEQIVNAGARQLGRDSSGDHKKLAAITACAAWLRRLVRDVRQPLRSPGEEESRRRDLDEPDDQGIPF